MRTEPDGSWSNHWSLLPQRLADQYPELIHIEAQSLFYHFAASAKGLSMLFDDDRPIPPDVLSIHLWAHLWWSRRRTDFSLFHEGRLTEQFIREVDTTFNRAARPFLPSISPTKRDAAAPMACRWKAAASDRIDAAGDDMRALAGLAVFPVIRTISPGFGRLHLARAHWIYRRAQRRFRPLRGPLEPAILRWVIQFDEYGVFHRRFEPGDVVLDIGAHLGSFSFACHAMPWAAARSTPLNRWPKISHD